MAALIDVSGDALSEGLSRSDFDLAVHPDDLRSVRSTWRAAEENGGLVCVEFRLAPAWSDARWIALRGHYAKGADGRVVQGRGVVMDVTASRQRTTASVSTHPDPAGEAEALDRAAEHALAARRAIDDLGVPGLLLRPAVDALLLEIGRRLSGKSGPAIQIKR